MSILATSNYYANYYVQTEQFIESIFPSQEKPAKVAPLSPEAAALAKKEASEDRMDMVYMGMAVGFTLLIITGSMVSPRTHNT